jgi:hypothetical protein
MASYIFQAILVCGWVGLLFFFLNGALNEDGLLYILGAVVMTVITVAIIIGAASQEENKGPCVKYETQLSYNAATKTTMPYRVCAERGEWVKNG